jgi:hypothetical protein
VAELARDELADIMALSEGINALEKRIAARARAPAPSLLEVFGCAVDNDGAKSENGCASAQYRYAPVIGKQPKVEMRCSTA